MSLIKKEELKNIVELTKTVPEEYRQKCFELLLSKALMALTAEASLVPVEASVAAPRARAAAKEFVMPIDVRAFLSQYNLDEGMLWKYFLVEGTEIRPIYKLKTTKKAKAQIQHALMLTLETALRTSQFETDVESLRQRCKDEKSYDAPNFMTNLKSNADLFKDFAADQPLRLSPDGKSELADLLESLGG